MLLSRTQMLQMYMYKWNYTEENFFHIICKYKLTYKLCINSASCLMNDSYSLADLVYSYCETVVIRIAG